MRCIVIKTCFVFSLMMTFLISSALPIKTQEELLEVLDLESSKVVLRVLHGLRNNQKPDLSNEIPSDTPNRVEKAHRVINILSLFFNKKIIKINKTCMRKLKEFEKRFHGEELVIYQRFLHEWQVNKECKYGQRTPSLEHNFNESITSEIESDFILIEEPAPQTSPIVSTSTLPPHVDLDVLKVLSGFVLIDEYYSPTEGTFITSKVISAAEAARLSVPSAPSSLAAVLSTSTDTSTAQVAMPSTSTDTSTTQVAMPSTSTDTSTAQVAMPSTSTDTSTAQVAMPSTSTDTSTTQVAMPSTSTDTSTAQVAMTSTSTDMSATIASLPSTQRPIEHDTFLEVLDAKSAKIILKSILNGYRIPTKEFNLKSTTDQGRYGKVAAYLLWILSNKEEKVSRQKAVLVSGQPRFRFDSDWYESKLKKYENYRKAITNPASGKSFFANILSRFTSIVP